MVRVPQVVVSAIARGMRNGESVVSEDRVHEQIRTWARDLIDLTKRNNSLYFKQLKRGTLRLVGPAPMPLFEVLMEGASLRVELPEPKSNDGDGTERVAGRSSSPAADVADLDDLDPFALLDVGKAPRLDVDAVPPAPTLGDSPPPRSPPPTSPPPTSVSTEKPLPPGMVRSGRDTRRGIQHIPGREIEDAVHQLLVEARSATPDELLVGVRDLFGFKRMGANIAAALDTALDRLILDGRVERSEGVLMPT